MVPSGTCDQTDSIDLRPRFALVASWSTPTNSQLVDAAARLGYEALVVSPEEAAQRLSVWDIAVGRIDVMPTFDGPEPGLEALRRLELDHVAVLNRAGSLLGAHDKLVTALRLASCNLPHPRTAHVGEGAQVDLEFPVVVKPRFGSWGKDVSLCRSPSALRRVLRGLRRRPWFQRQGALVQELAGPPGRDLRVLVAAGEVVGAIERVAAPREWRTNVALGGRRQPVVPAPEACYLALRAAEAIGADLVGVDLLRDRRGDFTVLELNGAVDFTQDYALDGGDVFEQVVGSLSRYARRDEEEAAKATAGLSSGARP